MTLSPIVLFLYRRPTNVEILLPIIIQSKPKRVYIFIDGPINENVALSVKKVTSKVKEVISNNRSIEWIIKRRRKNLGVKLNILKSLDEVFKKEKSAIILEDDCLPCLSFFAFSNKLLAYYENVNNVLSISGASNYDTDTDSYFFTKYPRPWGWATWRRAWGNFKFEYRSLSTIDIKIVSNNVNDKLGTWYWINILHLVKKKMIKSWDYQWTYMHWCCNAYSIMPSKNLVENVGFDGAAHHSYIRSPLFNLKAKTMKIGNLKKLAVERFYNDRSVLYKVYLNYVSIFGLIFRLIKQRLGYKNE